METTFASDPLRVALVLLLLAILIVIVAATMWLETQIGREDGALDERDEAVLARASATQAGAILVTLMIWTVGMEEHFHWAGAVPVSPRSPSPGSSEPTWSRCSTSRRTEPAASPNVGMPAVCRFGRHAGPRAFFAWKQIARSRK